MRLGVDRLVGIERIGQAHPARGAGHELRDPLRARQRFPDQVRAAIAEHAIAGRRLTARFGR